MRSARPGQSWRKGEYSAASDRDAWRRELHVFAAAMFVVIALLPWTARTAAAVEKPSGRDADVEAVINRADSLAELFEYEAAAKMLEKALVSGLPVEKKIRVNTKLASIYEQNLNEQQAIDCLLENLRSLPSYQLPESLKSQLQRLYEKALTRFREEKARQNQPPELGKLPNSKSGSVGERIEFQVTASDPEGEPVTLSVGESSGATMDARGAGRGTVQYTPPAAAAGRSVPIWVYASDGHLRDSARVMVDVRMGPALSPSAPVRSMILPGWGQRSKGNGTLGTVFLIGEAAALGAAVITTLSYNSAVGDYNSAYDRHQSATTLAELTSSWNDMNSKYNSAKSARSLRNLTYVAAGAIYVVNILEAALSNPAGGPDSTEHSDAGSGRGLRPDLRLTGNGVVIALRF